MTTEDFRRRNRRRRTLSNAAFGIGLTCLLLAPFVMNKLYDTPEQAMEITMPETNRTSIEDSDSRIYFYLINDDSIVLIDNNLIGIIDIAEADSILQIENKRNVILKSDDRTTYNTVVKALDIMNSASIQRFALVRCKPKELDSAIRLTQKDY